MTISRERKMPQRLINALISEGWNYQLIALRSGVSENRLRQGTIGVRETRKLEELICRETRLEIDDIYGEEE